MQASHAPGARARHPRSRMVRIEALTITGGPRSSGSGALSGRPLGRLSGEVGASWALVWVLEAGEPVEGANDFGLAFLPVGLDLSARDG